jgi:hypothetical protein
MHEYTVILSGFCNMELEQISSTFKIHNLCPRGGRECSDLMFLRKQEVDLLISSAVAAQLTVILEVLGLNSGRLSKFTFNLFFQSLQFSPRLGP